MGKSNKLKREKAFRQKGSEKRCVYSGEVVNGSDVVKVKYAKDYVESRKKIQVVKAIFGILFVVYFMSNSLALDLSYGSSNNNLTLLYGSDEYLFSSNIFINSSGSSSFPEIDPFWTGNWTNVAFINKANNFGAFNQTFDTNTLFIDSVNNRIGIGKTNPSYKLDVVGTGRFSSTLSASEINSDGIVTGNSGYFSLSSSDFIISPGSVDAERETGFFYIPITDGAPSGFPSGGEGRSFPMTYDSSNHQLCVYDIAETAWYCVTMESL